MRASSCFTKDLTSKTSPMLPSIHFLKDGTQRSQSRRERNAQTIGQNVANQERAERLHIVTRFKFPVSFPQPIEHFDCFTLCHSKSITKPHIETTNTQEK